MTSNCDATITNYLTTQGKKRTSASVVSAKEAETEISLLLFRRLHADIYIYIFLGSLPRDQLLKAYSQNNET